MSNLTRRMKWPFPEKDQDPWYDDFSGMTDGMDASGYAAREDRQLLPTGGGFFSFTSSSGVLAWTAALNIVSPIAGFLESVPAGSITLQDGQVAYLTLVRSPITNITLAFTVANTVPNLDDPWVFCVRRGSDVYFRIGRKLSDGQTIDIFAGGGGGGGGTATALQTATTVVGVSASPAPTNRMVLIASSGTAAAWGRLTQDMILPAFAISSFAGPSSPVEVGAQISNPAFTATYDRPAAAVTLDDGSGPISLTVPPYTSFQYGTPPLPAQNYQRNTVNGTFVWTLAGNETGSPTASRTLTVQWQARAYFGISTVPGAYNSAFITGLSNSGLQQNLVRQISYLAPGGTEKLYYVFPTSFGAPVSFRDDATGFAVPFTKVASAVNVTNANSVVIAYDVWESDNFLTAAVVVDIS